MKGKRLLILLMTATMTIGTAAPVFADTRIEVMGASTAGQEANAKVTKAQAKETAKKMLKDYFELTIDENKYQTNVQYVQDYDGFHKGYLWIISWNMQSGEKSIGVNVSVDSESGSVVNVNKYEYVNGENRPTVATITEDQAREKAENFIKKIHGPLFSQLKYMNDQNSGYKGNYASTYNFRYLRNVNGVPFEGNYVTVEVDGVTGNILSYSYRWNDNLQFPTSEGSITKEKADEIYRQSVKMTLTYRPYMNKFEMDPNPQKVRLAYVPDFSNGYAVDAKEGKLLDWNYQMKDPSSKRNLTEEQRAKLIAESQPAKRLDKEIDNNRAEIVMKEKLKELLGEEYEVDSINFIEDANNYETKGRNAWSGHFYKKGELGTGYSKDGQIMIDAFTEELISMYSYYPYDNAGNFTPKCTWEEAYDLAIQAIVKYFPGKIKYINTEQTHIKNSMYIDGKDVGERQYYFNFQRLQDGIPYSDNYVTVCVDAATGTFRELRSIWSDTIQLPSANGVITQEDAKEIYFQKMKPDLVYTMINKSTDPNKPEMEIKLIYRLNAEPMYNTGFYIDAFSGKFIGYDGEEIDADYPVFKEKIKGSAAEKELTILASQGILETKGFELKKEVTRIDLVKILVNAKGYRPYALKGAEDLTFTNIKKDDANYKYLQQAVQYGIIQNKEGKFVAEEKITREELAKSLVQLLQYDKLANAEEIFKLPYKDAAQISKGYTGYVAIARGLGILTGKDGSFKPKEIVKMEEVGAAVYKVVSNLKVN